MKILVAFNVGTYDVDLYSSVEAFLADQDQEHLVMFNDNDIRAGVETITSELNDDGYVVVEHEVYDVVIRLEYKDVQE